MNNVMSFEGRGRSFESQFALDQEITFKIHAKATRMVAEWAAERLGLDADNTLTFVENTKELALKDPAQGAFKAKILADFAANQIDISENALERLIALKNQQAAKQVLSEISH